MSKTRYNPQRALLTRFRGDYLHPGEEEAIKFVLKDIQKFTESQSEESSKNLKVLDVGCGLGSTAAYMYTSGYNDIVGVDIDSVAVEYASRLYPKINFKVGDALALNELFQPASFDIIYLFNSFYAFSDQKKMLHALSKIAKPGALLMIFDYSHRDPSKPHGMIDLAGKPMNPIITTNLRQWLLEAGWELLEEIDLTSQYKQWYQSLLDQLEQQKKLLIKEFSSAVFDKVKNTFQSIINLIDQNILGGIVSYARFKGKLFKDKEMSVDIVKKLDKAKSQKLSKL